MAIYTTFEEVELNLSKEIVLRKEQEDAIRLAKQHFGKTKRDVGYTLNPNFQQFLWNANWHKKCNLLSCSFRLRMLYFIDLFPLHCGLHATPQRSNPDKYPVSACPALADQC